VLLPFMWHVDCACFNGLWGRAGWAPADGAPAPRSCLYPAPGRGLACTIYTRRILGKGLGGGAGRRPGPAPPLGEPRSKLASCQFVMHGEMST
jgi:hypothetical protein